MIINDRLQYIAGFFHSQFFPVNKLAQRVNLYEVYSNMAEIYVLKIDKRIDNEKFDSLMYYLDKEKQGLIKRFFKKEDSERALLSNLLIRFIVINKFLIDNKEIKFEINEYGKPYLENITFFHFNLSHSGEWIVCAIDNKEIGIDVEEMRIIDFKIANRFFSQQEIIDLNSKAQEEKHTYFYDLWTLKESYIKAWGKGLSVPLNSFSIKIYPDGSIKVNTSNTFRNCYFKQYDIDSNYKMAVCSLKNEFPSNLIIKSIDNIIEFFNEHL